MKSKKKQDAIARLQDALGTIAGLKSVSRKSPEFQKWQRNTKIAIKNTFDQDSGHVEEFSAVDYSLWAFGADTPESEFHEAYVRGLETAEAMLESMIQEICEYWEEDSQDSPSDLTETDRLHFSRKVFIVHGRDDAAKLLLADFLRKLGLEPIILHEQPNVGQTIIEKFEDHSEVGYAVVLLTPDDRGGLSEEGDSLSPRARQNVVLELGFFMGKLGRKRVCALVKGDVELPSDYDGILYIELDGSEGWKWNLLKELRGAGFTVDANQAL